MKTTAATTVTTTKNTADYENNPFYVATNGLDLLFKHAQSVGIVAAILAALSAFSSVPSMIFRGSEPAAPASPASPAQATSGGGDPTQIPFEFWLILAAGVLIVLVVVFFVGVIVRGVLDYTSAKIARGETVTISEAFRGLFSNFWSYAWVRLIIGVKTFLWTLLFIIPGVIMSVRYSLAGVAFFDTQLRGNAPVKHSAAITKGAWLTTFASQSLLNILTFGIIQTLLTSGTNAVLYRQLDSVDVKPRAHVLSWLTLIVPIVLALLFLAVVILIINAVSD